MKLKKKKKRKRGREGDDTEVEPDERGEGPPRSHPGEDARGGGHRVVRCRGQRGREGVAPSGNVSKVPEPREREGGEESLAVRRVRESSQN